MPCPMNATKELGQIISCPGGAFDIHQETVVSSKAEALDETTQQ